MSRSAHSARMRRRITKLLATAGSILLVLGFVWFVRTMMSAKVQKQGRQVQIVQIITPPPPPPPPPDQPPPPPVKTEPLPKDEPEPTPKADEPPPMQQLGLDANGTAGSDAFGLAANRGGSDLVGGNGSSAFAWYTGRLKDAVLAKLSSDAHIGSKRFSLSVRVWIEPDGRVKEVKLASTTGSKDLDQRIETALSTLVKLDDSPPSEMPQPVSLKIVSRS